MRRRSSAPQGRGATLDALRKKSRHARTRKRGAAPLQVADLDVATVLAFLRHVEAERECSALTRSAWLAAVKSFFGFVAVHEPAALHIRALRSAPET